MVGRLNFSLRTQGKYPCVFTDYRDLVGHLRDRSGACFEKATSGSILIPLLGAWLSAIGDRPALKMLTELIPSKLAHCVHCSFGCLIWQLRMNCISEVRITALLFAISVFPELERSFWI
jgi:hypothetical protein